MPTYKAGFTTIMHELHPRFAKAQRERNKPRHMWVVRRRTDPEAYVAMTKEKSVVGLMNCIINKDRDGQRQEL